MPSSPFKKAMKEYLKHCYQRGLTNETIKSYESTIKRVEKILTQEGLNTSPKRFGPEELGTLIRAYRGKPDTIRKYKIFLKFNDNHISFPRIPAPNPRRTWLTMEEAELLRASDMKPIERMIIHLGLDLGFRRIEMARAEVNHFKGRSILVIGKGTFGGKKRYLKLTSLTKWILTDYLSEKHPGKHLLTHRKGSYTPNGITGIIWRLSKRLDIPFSSHTLRRTFARSLREQGARIETIRDILGHSNLDETEKYIGSNINQMDTALVEYHLKCSQRTIQMKLK